VQQKRENREFVVIGGDPEAARLRAALEGRGIGLAQGDGDLVVPVNVDTDTSSAQGPAPLALAGDRLEKGEPAETEKAVVHGRGTVAPVEAGIDRPDAILGKPAVDGDAEGPIGHGQESLERRWEVNHQIAACRSCPVE
jgi:hypothetical protein